MSYAAPYERPVPRGGFEIVHGPEALADTIVQQYRKRWIAWVATGGIRFTTYTQGMNLGDAVGSANGLFTSGERPPKFSFSFEQDALYALAFESPTNTIKLRRFVSGTPTEYTWTGKSPVLFYNGIVQPNTSITDLMAFYIKTPGDKIYVRVQRENFGTEHVLNGALNATLTELVKTEALDIDGSWHQQIWAKDDQGHDVVYQSRAYPPPFAHALDHMSLAVELSGGVHFNTVINASVSDKMSVAVSVDSGLAFNTVLNRFAPGDLMSLGVLVNTSSYDLIIVSPGTRPSDSMSLNLSVDTGNYPLVAISQAASPDKISLDVSVSGGDYT